jgi:hypothetical protein
MGPNRPPYSPPERLPAPEWGVCGPEGVEALRMAVWPSQRNQASQGLLNRGFRPLSVEHLFGIGACPGREPGWRAGPLRLGSRPSAPPSRRCRLRR